MAVMVSIGMVACKRWGRCVEPAIRHGVVSMLTAPTVSPATSARAPFYCLNTFVFQTTGVGVWHGPVGAVHMAAAF